jgi:4'-phosphopantetheinyl transferase
VHVWRVTLDSKEGTADRVLRDVVAHYLDEDPVKIELGHGERGKPMLADPSASLRFNLSHSGDLALVAVAWDREVGVDVERIAPRRNLLGLARRGLGPEEAARIESLPPEERAPAFYAAWTRREAVAKCHGVGLGAPLPDAPVAVADFDAAPGYAAAVAVTGERLPPLRRFELDVGRAPVADDVS